MKNQFSNQIGRGGYGPIFYGQLPNGEEVAVKVLSENSKQGAKEFKNDKRAAGDINTRQSFDNIFAATSHIPFPIKC